VFGVGEEPDPRFTLANERTFLAWVRTSLALVAAGVALDAFVQGVMPALRRTAAVLLIVIGIVCGAAAYTRWMASERALRLHQPLPAPALAPVLAYTVAAVGLLAALLVLLRP
jgi:putative membrane protein